MAGYELQADGQKTVNTKCNSCAISPRMVTSLHPTSYPTQGILENEQNLSERQRRILFLYRSQHSSLRVRTLSVLEIIFR
jgi:hypothetical protein